MKKCLALLLTAVMLLTCVAAMAENTEAPRSYFPYPSELENLPESWSLPDPFRFFDASADPNGNGLVDSAEEWDARAAEIRDMAQYYLYGNRMDPLKGDTVITDLIENFEYRWGEGVMTSAASMFGYTSLPNLPEGSFTYIPMDFSMWGMGVFYGSVTPVEGYVHEGDDFVISDNLKPWKKGDTWADHADAMQKVKLPTVTVKINIKDTDPAHQEYVSEAARTEGISFTFSIRFPETAPTVDGVVRDEKASRYGDGYPVLVCIGGLSEEQIVTLNGNGYAYISVSDAADPDNGQTNTYEKVYPPIDIVVHNDNTTVNPYVLDSGDLMASGWAASRALDAIEWYKALSAEEKAAINPNVTLPDIDTCSSAVTGCSNNGKRALMAALYDTGDNGSTRFDIVAPDDSGAAGTTGFRYITEGQLFSYEPPVQNQGGVVVHDYAYGMNETMQRAVQNTGEDQWFDDRAQIFTVRPDVADNVPFDTHEILASFATAKEERYLVTWTGEAQDAWGNHPATILDMLAAQEVFELLGQGGNVVAVARDQAHANQDRDLPELMAIMDHLFYGTEKYVRKHFDTLTKANGRDAIDGNGTILPEKVFDTAAEMSRYPYDLPSGLINWTRPGKYMLWTNENSVTEGVATTFTFYTDAPEVTLTLTDGTVLSARAEDGKARIAITAEQAKAGRYAARTVGELDERMIEIRGWSIKDALRHAITDNSALGHDAGSGICFTTPLVNYNDENDPVLLYLDGEPIPTDIYDYDNKITLADGTVVPQSGYLQPYGATLILYADTMGYNVPMDATVVYSMRNAKIEALQGFVLSVDVELQKYCPSGNRMRFKTTYNTISTQTPVWEPELLQNTPVKGLPKDETAWPVLGNWVYDYDENGNLKPIEEIRPVYSAEKDSGYNAELSLGASDENGFTVLFSAPVNRNDFAIAVNVPAYIYVWNDDATAVTVTYDAPAQGDVTAFVFRSVDMNGNMINGPVCFNIAK